MNSEDKGAPASEAGRVKTWWHQYLTKLRGRASTGPSTVALGEILWSWVGAFLGIGALSLLNSNLLAPADNLLLIGSLGASAVLVYGAPRSPLAQPRNSGRPQPVTGPAPQPGRRPSPIRDGRGPVLSAVEPLAVAVGPPGRGHGHRPHAPDSHPAPAWGGHGPDRRGRFGPGPCPGPEVRPDARRCRGAGAAGGCPPGQ